MVLVLFILSLIFLFINLPLGILLFIIALVALVFKVIGGTGKAISKAVTTKKCPYCYSQIDAKAKVCPLCHKDIIGDNNENVVDKKPINEDLNEPVKKENTMNVYIIKEDYKEFISELNKIYNLYKNEIYSKEEYVSRKNRLIENLKAFNFQKVESDFLNDIIPFVKDNILDNDELKKIKYIISGEYSRDKLEQEQENKIKLEGEQRKKKEEFVNNIKNKTKQVTYDTVDKINSIIKNSPGEIKNVNDSLICECGEKLDDECIYCPNCGKKIK